MAQGVEKPKQTMSPQNNIPSTSGSRSPKKPMSRLPNAKNRNKKESKLKSATSTPDISLKAPLKPKKSSSAGNSRSTSPNPQIEVTYVNVGELDLKVDLDVDLDPVYDNAVGVLAHALDRPKTQDFHGNTLQVIVHEVLEHVLAFCMHFMDWFLSLRKFQVHKTMMTVSF